MDVPTTGSQTEERRGSPGRECRFHKQSANLLQGRIRLGRSGEGGPEVGCSECSQEDDIRKAKQAAARAYQEDAYLSGTDRLLWQLYATSYDLEQFSDAVKYCVEGGRRFPKNSLFIRCRLWLLTTPQFRPELAG